MRWRAKAHNISNFSPSEAMSISNYIRMFTLDKRLEMYIKKSAG